MDVSRERPLSVLCVCTHNRTRSVLAGALLGLHLESAGVLATVRTAGTMADGQPAIDRATYLLSERGIDVSAHRSQGVDDVVVEASDLIVTAERTHVAWIAGRYPGTFSRTFTLPEAVALGGRVGTRSGRAMHEWLGSLGEGRPMPADYLDADHVGEVADPTGGSPRVWDAAVAEIDRLTQQLARLLA